MDLYRKDPAVTKALALALMRQAHGLLLAVEEDDTAALLQLAVDQLARPRPVPLADTE